MLRFRLDYYLALSICILMFGCRKTGIDQTDKIAVIDVFQQLGKYQKIPVSEFITELDYIPLETCEDGLIGEINRGFLVTSTHIFVAGNAPLEFCYAFGRDGRFISKIGNRGQGPEEYSFFRGLSMDENKQSLFVDAQYDLLEYSWDGVFRRSFKIPPSTTLLMNNRVEPWQLDKIFFVRDNLFIGHSKNISGNERYNFHLINDSGQVVKSFDNHIQLNRSPRSSRAERTMRPFKIFERMYLKEIGNDTLYCLTEHDDLILQFVFDLGKYTFSKQKRENPVYDLRHYQDGVIEVPYELIPMIGTPDFIFFSMFIMDASTVNASFPPKPPRPAGSEPIPNVNYLDARSLLGIYDIVNQKTLLLDSDYFPRPMGLINDLDGGLSFWPKYYNSSDHELIDIWQAHHMKKYLTEEYFATHEIKDPQAHQKLKELLKNLKEDDNPVIVIGKMK